ncbi:MAG: type II secretion system F family protein, partial [Candidatus Eremiobacteraeota bacterium]|nr:type II secretion system F family protein [Candidatus Eremiobacteraeota bacterium]
LAQGREEVILALREQGCTLLDLKAEEPASEQTSPSSSPGPRFRLRGRMKPQVVAVFTRQLSELIKAGIPIVEALESMLEFSTCERFREVLVEVSSDILRGHGLAESLSKHPKVFDKLYVNMVKVGEAGGTVGEMISKLADYMDADLELRGKIRSALSYPIFTLVISMILFYCMLNFILPGFQPMWAEAELDMDSYPITKALLFLSNLTSSVWDELLLLIVVGGILYLFKAILRTPEAARATDRLVYKLPVIGSFIELTVMARISNTLATLISSGVPLAEALNLTAGTAGRIVVVEALQQVSARIQEGRDLSGAVRETKVFPPLMVQMIALGEKSGDLPSTLNRVALYYQGQLDNGIKSFSALLQPFSMLLIGGIVLLFVLGVFLPIMGVASHIQV